MVEWEIWRSIFVYIKNRLVSWSNDKELSSRLDAIYLKLFQKKKKKKKTHFPYGNTIIWEKEKMLRRIWVIFFQSVVWYIFGVERLLIEFLCVYKCERVIGYIGVLRLRVCERFCLYMFVRFVSDVFVNCEYWLMSLWLILLIV